MTSNLRTLVLEGLCALVLVFLAAGAAVMATATKIGVTQVGALPVSPTAVAVGFGVALVLLGLVTGRGPLAGSAVTPRVTLALWRRGQIGTERALDSWIGQVIGAAAAAIALLALLPSALAPDPGSSGIADITMSEVLLAALLTVGFLAVPTVGSVLVGSGASTQVRTERRSESRVAPASAPTPPPPAVVPLQLPTETEAMTSETLGEEAETTFEPAPVTVSSPREPLPDTAPLPEPEPVSHGEPAALVASTAPLTATGTATPRTPAPTLTVPVARVSRPRSTRPVTRVRSPFPAGPTKTAVRRTAVNRDPDTGDAIASAEERAKSGKANKKDKSKKNKKRTSTVVVQVKVAETKDSGKKSGKGKKKKDKK